MRVSGTGQVKGAVGDLKGENDPENQGGGRVLACDVADPLPSPPAGLGGAPPIRRPHDLPHRQYCQTLSNIEYCPKRVTGIHIQGTRIHGRGCCIRLAHAMTAGGGGGGGGLGQKSRVGRRRDRKGRKHLRVDILALVPAVRGCLASTIVVVGLEIGMGCVKRNKHVNKHTTI